MCLASTEVKREVEGSPSNVESSGLQLNEGKDDDFYCWEECKRIYLVHYRNCGPWDDKKTSKKYVLNASES